jgi:hypothetical protein
MNAVELPQLCSEKLERFETESGWRVGIKRIRSVMENPSRGHPLDERELRRENKCRV